MKFEVIIVRVLFLNLNILLATNVFSQFYNGLQMEFGKNRVQYNDFLWQYYRFERFDTYFYVNGRELAEYAGRIASEKLSEVEAFFDYTLEKRIVFIIYNKLSDFRQSNMAYISGKEQYNIGGVTQIVGNKVIIYSDGEHLKFEKQITAAITEVLINEMLFGNEIKDRIVNYSLLNLPDWYIKGLISYVSNEWDATIDNYVKDGILSGRFKKFNRIYGDDAVYAGHSIWNYIANTYGENVIPNILYFSRISKSYENGFMYVLGIPLKYLTSEWLAYYEKKYREVENNREIPTSPTIQKRTSKSKKYYQLCLNPVIPYAAYVTNELGRYKIWISNLETHKRTCILTREHRLDQITDYSYPLLAWHPKGELLTYIIERRGNIYINYYDITTQHTDVIQLIHFEKVLSFSYSHDGLKLVISAVKDGNTDLFVYNIPSNAIERITNDVSDELNPKFINNSTQIIFSSNRNTLLVSNTKSKTEPPTNKTYDIFIYDYKNNSKVLTRLSETLFTNEIMPSNTAKNQYLYLSDNNGVFNRYIAKYDSTISFIDTITHYRYYTSEYPITNFSRNIIEYDFNSSTNKIGEVQYYNGKYHLHYSDFSDKENQFKGTYLNSEYRKKYIDKHTSKSDSIITPKQPLYYKKTTYSNLKSNNNDTLSNTINILNYVFEEEKNNKSDTPQVDASLHSGNTKFQLPKQLVYFTSFYTNYFVSQVDFGFLNSSYQPFTGGEVYFNPGINVFFKIGTFDLFEDYKVTGGFRLSHNIDNNEYVISIENLKKRIDKELIFHRQALTTSDGYALYKMHSHLLMYVFKYPINQVQSFRTSIITRYDRNVPLATESKYLHKKNEYNEWAGIKLEYVFDNARNLGLNLYQGTRAKIFGEGYRQVDKKNTALFTLGYDIRHYQKIHRTIIWANRAAAGTSFGNSRLLYYLGSVDNWINLSPKVEKFDNTVNIDRTQNWVYQTLATNMRGFTQNIRNGNNFVVFNTELRFPVIKYFLNRPINSDFLENFQFITFTDVGTAWSGKSPNDNKNAYNYDLIIRGPIKIIINKDRKPWVSGFGFGLRSRILGYFIRADWAWGVENNYILPKMFYLSLSLDF